MNRRKYIDWHFVLGLMALPLVAALIFLWLGWVQSQTRYNPRYFTPEYLEVYSSPTSVVFELERALQSGDAILVAELRGTRQVPTGLQPQPNLEASIFHFDEGKYLNYLFFEQPSYGRYVKHIREYNGRYIEVPEGIYFYMDSGRWLDIFLPLAFFWWILLLLFTGGVWFYRAMAAEREKMYG